MALVFCDGFDSYAATADLLKKWIRADSSWAWSTGADQNAATGGIVSCASPASVAHMRPSTNMFTASTTRIGIGFWLKVSAAPAATNIDVMQWFNSAGTFLGALRLTTSGFMQLINSSTGSVFIGTTNVCDNAWHWIEVAPQTGTNVLQRGVADSTSQWNSNASMYGAVGYFDRLSFLSIASRTISISDVILYDNAGTAFTVDASFPLTARKITTKRPDGDDVIQLGRSTGTTNYTLIDEVNADTSDYVEGITAVQDTYNYAAIGISPTTVNAVMVNSYLATPLPGFINFKQLAKSNVTTTEGASLLAPSVTPRTIQQPFYVDPNTAAAWTQAGIDAAKFGIKVEGPTSKVFFLGHIAAQGVASTYTFNNVYIGPPSADRLVVAFFYGQTNNRTVNNVTIGGVAATINIQSNDAGVDFDDVGLCMASLVVPAGTTATLFIGWNGFCDSTGVAVYVIYGASSPTPTDTAHGASAVSNPTAQIDVANNGVIIAGYMNMDFPAVDWVGLNVEASDTIFTGNGGTSRISMAHQIGLGSETNRTITVTQSAYTEMGAFVACSWVLL